MNKYSKLLELITVFSEKSINSYRLKKIAMNLEEFADNSIIYDSHPILNNLITKLSDSAANVQEILVGNGDPEDLIDFVGKFYHAYDALLNSDDLKQPYEIFMEGEDPDNALAPQDLLTYIHDGIESLNNEVEKFTGHNLSELMSSKVEEYQAEFDKSQGGGFQFSDPTGAQRRAQEKHLENIRFLKKIDPNNPKFIEAKRRARENYEIFKQSPEFEEFRLKKRKENQEGYQAAKKRKVDLEMLLTEQMSAGRRQNLEEELLKVNKRLMNYGPEYTLKQELADKQRSENKKNSDSFHGQYTALRTAKDNIRGLAKTKIVQSLSSISGELTTKLFEARKLSSEAKKNGDTAKLNEAESTKENIIKQLRVLAEQTPEFKEVSNDVEQIESGMRIIKPFGKAVNPIDSRTLDNKSFLTAGAGKEAIINLASAFGSKYPKIIQPSENIVRLLNEAIEEYIERESAIKE